MTTLTRHDMLSIARIIRVNHAGETGAIRIYGAQMSLAGRWFPDIVPALASMRDDEIRHCEIFRTAMRQRQTRPCRIMSLWSLGGYVIGFSTALFGRNMIWICTEAVETTVHRHLVEQLRFLKHRDPELHDLIDGITEEELAHRDHAVAMQQNRRLIGKFAYGVISSLTATMIWLSTWGDPSLMVRDLKKG